MMNDQLTCQQLVEIVTDYLEESMPLAERELFDAHLAVCPGCVTYVDQMRQTIQAVGRVHVDMFDPSAQAELVMLFRAWKAGA
ncbi:MAG TPA: zf-HC2 domain-containing protein [Thermomicrobiales bacterium]|nr:zf-HC2 domain-containing protein [Thermomicrobiales bacterium]